MGYLFCRPEENELTVRDKYGNEIMAVSFTGGFVVSHPGPDSGYTLWCRRDDEEAEQL